MWRTLLRRGTLHCGAFSLACLATTAVPPITALTGIMMFSGSCMRTDIPSSSALAGVSVLSLVLELAWNSGEAAVHFLQGIAAVISPSAPGAAAAGAAAEESRSMKLSTAQQQTIEALGEINSGWTILSIAAIVGMWKLSRVKAKFEGRIFAGDPLNCRCCTMPNLRMRNARITGARRAPTARCLLARDEQLYTWYACTRELVWHCIHTCLLFTPLFLLLFSFPQKAHKSYHNAEPAAAARGAIAPAHSDAALVRVSRRVLSTAYPFVATLAIVGNFEVKTLCVSAAALVASAAASPSSRSAPPCRSD